VTGCQFILSAKWVEESVIKTNDCGGDVAPGEEFCAFHTDLIETGMEVSKKLKELAKTVPKRSMMGTEFLVHFDRLRDEHARLWEPFRKRWPDRVK